MFNDNKNIFIKNFKNVTIVCQYQSIFVATGFDEFGNEEDFGSFCRLNIKRIYMT